MSRHDAFCQSHFRGSLRRRALRCTRVQSGVAFRQLRGNADASAAFSCRWIFEHVHRCAASLRPRLSRQIRARDRADRRGRQPRFHSASRRPENERKPQAAIRRRQSPRRQRHHRRGTRGAGAGRRLHAPVRRHRPYRHASRALREAALRRRQGFCADLQTGRCTVCPFRPSVAAGGERARTRRAGQGASGPDHLRELRRRQLSALSVRGVQRADRRANVARAVQGQRAGVGRTSRGARHVRLRRPAGHAAAGAGQAPARTCDRRQRSVRRRHRRSRLSRKRASPASRRARGSGCWPRRRRRAKSS